MTKMFRYAFFGSRTMPEYEAHHNQLVEVLGVAQEETSEDEGMTRIRAADGWEGEAFDSELEEVP